MIPEYILLSLSRETPRIGRTEQNYSGLHRQRILGAKHPRTAKAKELIDTLRSKDTEILRTELA